MGVQVIVDEFLSGGQTSGIIGELGWVLTSAVGTATATRQGASANHSGVLRLSTSAAANDRAVLALGSTTVIDPSHFRGLAFLMKVNSTANVVVRIGAGQDLTSSTFGTDGVWIEYDPALSPDWFLVTRRAGSSTRSHIIVTGSTGWPVTTDWARLEINHRAGTACNGHVADANQDADVSTTSTPPTSSVMLNLGVQITTTTNAAKTIDLDRFTLQFGLSPAGRFRPDI